jgi:predicted amidophosphoribosyltransferase
MARAIKARMNGAPAVGRWLRFAEPMLQSHAGGTRNKATLEDAMRCSPAATECRVVLVDDVKTTGGHLRACASVLRKAGATVETVVVAASTVWEQHPDPLNVDPVDLEAVHDFDWDDL